MITEEKIVELYTNDISITKINKLYKISKWNIRKILIKNNCKIINKQNLVNISDEEAIKLLNQGYSLEKISKNYKCSADCLSKRLKKKGIIINNLQNERNTNIDIFEKIDNEEKAYWLGFLYADGNLSKNFNKTISIALKESDINHLEKFKKFIECKNSIKLIEKYKAVRFNFSSKKVHKDLINLGCVPAKSLILTFPTEQQVPLEFQRHFIRGYFDGDGCLSYSNNNKLLNNPTLYPSVSLIGTENIVNKINDLFNSNNRITLANKNGSDKIFTLSFNKQNRSNFLNYIYDNSTIYLERKYKRYLIFKNNNFAVLKSNFQNY